APLMPPRQDERSVNRTAQIHASRQRYFPSLSNSLNRVNAKKLAEKAGDAFRMSHAQENRERGCGEVAEIADTSMVRRSSSRDAGAVAPGAGDGLMPLASISAAQWRGLSERAAEPNGYYLPEWELAVNASARGRVDTDA